MALNLGTPNPVGSDQTPKDGYIYTAPELPNGENWDATTCPGNPRLYLVHVKAWPSEADRLAYEALPGVIRHGDIKSQTHVHPQIADGCGAWGVTSSDSYASAFRKIATFWEPLRVAL